MQSKIKVLPCGKEMSTGASIGRHLEVCDVCSDDRTNKLAELESSEKDYIISHYSENFSANMLTKYLKEKYVNVYSFGLDIYRELIIKVLSEVGMYEGVSGKNMLNARNSRSIDTMNSRYGVSNWGQTELGGYSGLNGIERTTPSFVTSINEYKNKCDELTRVAVRRGKFKQSDYCEYTGIMFADVQQEKTNPNDYRKRSVDHKKSVIKSFLDGDSPEECCSQDNLVCTLKYCNSVKGNMSGEEFYPLALTIRELFINEGFAHN